MFLHETSDPNFDYQITSSETFNASLQLGHETSAGAFNLMTGCYVPVFNYLFYLFSDSVHQSSVHVENETKNDVPFGPNLLCQCLLCHCYLALLSDSSGYV